MPEDLLEIVGPRKAFENIEPVFIPMRALGTARKRSIAWCTDNLGLMRGAEYALPYSMINEAFGLSAETQTNITLVSHGKMPVVEVDYSGETSQPAAPAMATRFRLRG